MNAFAISGANASFPFDANASALAISASSTGAVTTSNADDFIFAGYRFASDSTPSAGTGWNAINASGGNFLSEYQIVSTTQTGLVATASSPDEIGGIGDAVQAAPPTRTAASVTVAAGSTLDLNNTTITGGSLTNAGTVEVSGDSTSTLTDISVINTTSALALDGNAFFTGFEDAFNIRTTSTSVTLTTSNANDVIILYIAQSGATVNSVSDAAGLTWHQRAVAGSGSNTIYEYYAIASNALSADAITVEFSNRPALVDLNAFGISGANTSSPFDTSVLTTPASSTGTVTTTYANDFIFAGYRFSSDSIPDPGTGWTAINAGGGYYLSEYQVVSATQADLVATASTSDEIGGIVDAVQAAAASTTTAATVTVTIGSTLDLDSTTVSGGTLNNLGTIDATGTSALNRVGVTNSGLIEATSGKLTIDPAITTNTGTIEAASGATIDLVSLNVANSGGAVQIDSGATLDLAGTVITGGTLNNLGTVNSTGTSALNGVGVTNSGLMEATGGTLTIDPTSTTNTGTIEAASGATVSLSGIAVANSGGTVKVDAGATLDLAGTTVTGGTLTNAGATEVLGGSTSTLSGVTVGNGGVGGVESPVALALDGNGFANKPCGLDLGQRHLDDVERQRRHHSGHCAERHQRQLGIRCGRPDLASAGGGRDGGADHL